MATTIDTLQIEIQSSSTSATAAIRDLSTALAELKANGTVNVAIKNLNNLSTALRNFSNANRAANSVAFLANALAKLKAVGPVGNIGNSLTKLSASLRTLDTLRIDNVGPQIQKIVEAVAPLSAVKAGGLNTMVNALSKIGKVTQELNDEKIAAFAERIEKLNTVLTPLSTKMTTIQAGFRGISSSARSAGSSVRDAGESINAASLNFSTLFFNVQNVVMVMQQAVQVFSNMIAEAIEWDGIAARFGRGFGAQAQETYEWIQRLNDEMGINVQQFMQYSSIYATMLTGFGVAHEDATKMALGYTELTYDIWAGYNDVYKTFGEASEAVKSAIAGEVEPIRRAGFTIIESTLEQTAANHGLEISLTNATEAQKSYLRYLTLVDQAQSQSLVGTYAKELNTAEGLMRTFSQQLKSLTQAFGSLFMPVLARVMPYLQAFVELLGEAVHWIAGLFGIEIQAVDFSGYESGAGAIEDVANSATDATDALGDAAKAAKAMKNATLGIDELNVISPPSASSGNGGSGGSGGSGGGAGFDGLDIDSLWDESIFDGIESKVDGIKEKFMDWLPVIQIISGALAGLAVTSLITSMGEALAQASTLSKVFSSIAILTIEAALVFTFTDNYLETGDLKNIIGEALVTAVGGYLMFKAWGPTGAVLALGISILAQLLAIEMSLADGTIELSSKELWIQSLSTILMGAFGGAIIATKTGFFAKEGFVIGLAASLSLVMTAINTGAIESGSIDTGSFESWIMQAISVAGAGMTGFTVGKALTSGGGKAGLLIGVTVGLVLNLASVIGAKGEDFGDNFSDWLNAGITAVMSGFTAVKLWGLIGPTIKGALAGIIPEISASIGTAFSTLATALASIPVWGWIAAAVIALLAGAITLAVVDYDFTDIGHKIGEAIGKAIRTAVDFVTNIGKAIWSGLKGAFDWVVENFELDSILDLFNPVHWVKVIIPNMISIGKDVLAGLWDGIKSGWDNFWSNIWEFIDGFIQGFKDGLGIASPSKIFKDVGGFLIEGLWNGISDWATKLHTKIKEFVTKVITKVKEFFGIDEEKKSSSIFSEIGDFLVQGLWNGINDKVDWIITKIGGWVDTVLEKVKKFFGIASPSKKFIEIGGFLTDGLVEGMTNLSALTEPIEDMWNKAKEWVKKADLDINIAPVVGDIKKNIEEKWNTAKEWWDKKKPKLASYTPSIGNISTTLSSGWGTAREWWAKKKPKLASYTPSIGSIFTPLRSSWNSAREWWNKKKPKLSSFTPTVGSLTAKLKSSWASAKKWWNKNVRLDTKLNIKVPTVKVKWEKASAFGKSFKYPKGFDLKFAAAGGIFDSGSLIWAGERGAEVVANAGGGKTGVMNIDQMQDAVYEGVYAAILAASRAGNNDGGGQAVNVYLDGKQITAAVEKRQRERGASLMGNQVYNY